jgi:hypothetical protein
MITAAYTKNPTVPARGTVTQIIRANNRVDDSIVVAFDDLGRIAIPRSFFDDHPGPGGRVDAGIDHAYAVTSYAVQGATYDQSTARVDERATRAETYVDVTRGRHANHLFVTRAEDPLDGERLPKAPNLPLEASLAIRLRASMGEITAWEIGEDAPAGTRTRPSTNPVPAPARRRR